MNARCLEIIRFRVDAASAGEFVRRRREVDAALAAFAGFLGSELAEGPDGAWTVVVRWADRAAVTAAQAVTLSAEGLPAIRAWTALAREFVSFETVDLRTPGAADTARPVPLDVARRFVTEGLGRADMRAFEALLDPDIVVTTALSPAGPIRGRAAYQQVFAGFADAWPVRSLVIDDLFAAGNRVVVSFTAEAVFRKDYFGVAATGVVAPLKEVHVMTVRDGRIVAIVVGAVNLPFEFVMYDALKGPVLDGLMTAD